MELFEPRPILLATGVLYIAMPMAVLMILYRRHDRLNVLVWCGASTGLGVAAVLFALRGMVPDWLSIPVANAAAYGSYFMRVPVLRRERGDAAQWGLWLAVWAAGSAAITTGFLAGWDDRHRVGFNTLVHALGAGLIAHHAWRLASQLDSVGVRLISIAYGAYAGLFVLRGVRTAAGLTDDIPISTQLDFLALTAAALLTSLCGNVGYLGMALDRARLKDEAQRQALDQLRAQRQALELAAREREAVLHERHRSSQVLAHEVRQPLHNAAVSLQAASAALAAGHEGAEVATAVAQAQAVLRRVSASLDNTVAAASLLTDDRHLVRQEVELEVLLGLCVGDLPPDARARVRIVHDADARSASLEPGLMRLALRNLLINATLYSPPGSPVWLRVLDSEQPLGLAIEVVDEGPGLPEPVRRLLDEPPAARVAGTASGHGLGLVIVRRVAERHQGRLVWQPHAPQGSVFRLLLPQDNPD